MRTLRVLWTAAVASALACAGEGASAGRPPAEAMGRAGAARASEGLLVAPPDEEGLDARPLVRLTEWIREADVPIFSLLISRDGVLVYELYTSSLTRDDAHYVMSVTKSFTSALVGVAMDRGLVGPPETSVADAIPADVFASPADRDRFRQVTLQDVLGMSALDAQVPPHRMLPEDWARQRLFLESRNRAAFAVTQAVLAEPGRSFQYTDITPLIATGVVEYATGKTALEFAEETLFRPMGFAHYEWMHEDPSGIDNGAYGLRLRPIDMQKFGILYLERGRWAGRQLVSTSWVDRSFSPWIRSSDAQKTPDYGWYWWTSSYGPHWLAHAARGWKGQRIVVVPERGIVVTMTGLIEGGHEEQVFARIMRDYVIPAMDGTDAEPARPDAGLRAPLAQLLDEVRRGPLRAGPGTEWRMIPSIEPKERRRPFVRGP
jgi:CubicO group peptidase (beta-lactamase class C family)